MPSACRFISSTPRLERPGPTSITPERPDTPDARASISELEAELTPLYPSESRHGYAAEKLISQAAAFFVIRHDGRPAGSGGIRLFGVEYGEVKRMYVRPQFRGLGLAKAMVDLGPPTREGTASDC